MKSHWRGISEIAAVTDWLNHKNVITEPDPLCEASRPQFFILLCCIHLKEFRALVRRIKNIYAPQ